MRSVPCPARRLSRFSAVDSAKGPLACLWKIRSSLAAILTGLALMSGTAMAAVAPPLLLAWNPNPEPDIAGYTLSYGTSSGRYETKIDAGLQTRASVTGLTEGQTYYFVISAYNRAGLVGPPSAEISFQVPSRSALELQVIPRTGWRVLSATSQEAPDYAAALAIDGQPDTFWHTSWKNGTSPHPHDIRIDLGSDQRLGGFRYLPRQDGLDVGTIAKYEFYVSRDGVSWGRAVASGSFAATQNEKQVIFSPTVGRYILLRSLAEIKGRSDTHIAELNLLRAANPAQPPTSFPTFGSTVIKNKPGSVRAPYKGRAIVATSTGAAGNLTYAKVSGPPWLKVSPTGELSGIPPLLAAGINRFIIRATDRNGNSAQTVLRIPVRIQPLPLPWKTRQLHSANLKALAMHRNSTFTLTGAGRLTGEADGGVLTWQTLGPNGEVTARIDKIGGNSPFSRAGVMVRASAAPNAANVFIGVDARKRFIRSRRFGAGGPTLVASRGAAPAADAWVRLVRNGNTVTTFTSRDGRKWNPAGKVTAKLGRNCMVGLYVGGEPKARIPAAFSKVRVVSKSRS